MNRFLVIIPISTWDKLCSGLCVREKIMQGPLCSTHTDMPMSLSVSDPYIYVDMPFSQKENSICGYHLVFF